MSETFGQRLKRLREAKGWTVIELAYKWHQDISVVNDWESGERKMFICEPMLDLAKLFGATMDYLYTGVEPSADTWANTPGKRIRLRRDELGDDGPKMVDRSGLSWVTLAHLEMDAYGDSIPVSLDKFASCLGVTAEWILTGAEPKFTPKPKEPDAEWFMGWSVANDIRCISMKTNGDMDTVSCVFHVRPGMAAKVIELIRTGKMPEDK